MPLSNVSAEQYQSQLDSKASDIQQQFSELQAPALQVFASPPLGYRMRAEFRLWHEQDDTFYVMFKRGEPKTPYRIDEFLIGSERIQQLMATLLAEINCQPVLRQRLFQVEFLTTLSGESLVTLIYHRALGLDWEQAARELQNTLNTKIIGRSKKQRIVLTQDYVTEVLSIAGTNFQFQQVENSFTQPNASVNQHMVSWALQHSKNNGGDLVELYCGNGNFTVVLAQNFGRVLATEISKTSVKSARHNFALNAVENVEVVRMSSEEFSSALAAERSFRRLKDIDLNSYQFSTVLVDPPRAGLDQHTVQLVSGFDNIIYISCNPNTLRDNLQTLCKTHRITEFAIFDQFPYTHHIECGVILSRH